MPSNMYFVCFEVWDLLLCLKYVLKKTKKCRRLIHKRAKKLLLSSVSERETLNSNWNYVLWSMIFLLEINKCQMSQQMLIKGPPIRAAVMSKILVRTSWFGHTLDLGIDVGPGKLDKNNKHRALDIAQKSTFHLFNKDVGPWKKSKINKRRSL